LITNLFLLYIRMTAHVDKKYIYTPEKKVKYVFSDYDEVVTEFNTRLIELFDEICKICSEKKWKNEIVDFGAYITTIEMAIKANKSIVIKKFASNVYPYYTYIKNRNEELLLNKKYTKNSEDVSRTGSSSSEPSIILKYKKLWTESGESNKEYLFQAIEYLCNLTEHYEHVAFMLKINNSLTSILK
jgi:hypothetical protein